MPEPRYKFAACAKGTDIFIFGGKNAQNNSQESVFKYDTLTDLWGILSMSPMPSASFEHSCCLLDGLIYIAGARDNGTGLMCFDPASRRWSTIGTMLSLVTQVSIFVLGGCLYVAEGNSESKASVERYDPTTNTWTVAAGVLENRRFFNAVTIGSASLPEKDLFDSLISKISN
jgi:N-acetylneuraminic acid mutarotase